MSTSTGGGPGPGKRRVCVIGAGVIGLSTAVRIQEESAGWGVPGVEVTVVADRYSPHTTSDGSGGFWEPYNFGDTPASLIRKWATGTWHHMYQLAMSPDLAAIVGAQLISGYMMSESPNMEESMYPDVVLGTRPLTQKELDMFPGVRSGYFQTSLLINVQKYLPWLMQRFKSAGGKTEFRTVHSISQEAKDYDVVVNCTGLGGGQLLSDKHVVPIRGQLWRIHAPWVKHFYLYESKDSTEPSYLLPVGDEVVVGGVAQRDNWNKEVDRRDSESIWRRAVAIFPFIKGGRILREWVGLRPGRSAVRLETDSCTVMGRRVPVVHNYGHGGSGVTLHWGCAAHATELVRDALLHTPTHSKL